MSATIDYKPDGKVLRAFMLSDAFCRLVIGPFGSGKTTACCFEVFRRCSTQPPNKDGVRQSRWAIIRATFPELKTTTIPSWRTWFSDGMGKFSWTPPFTHNLSFALQDGTRIEAEILFLALDGADGPDKLKGLELTGAWINEAREVPKAVLDTLLGRIGRYPPHSDDTESWCGVILDTNPFDVDHWLYRLAEEERPANWRVFKQPGGVIRSGSGWAANSAAENTRHLRRGYYLDQIAGQSDDWIRVHLGGEYGAVIDGKPVFPEFVDSVHTAAEPLAPLAHTPVVIGVDHGLSPAAVFLQRTANGRWLALAELVTEEGSMGAVAFARELATRIAAWFPGLQCEAWTDPAGMQRSQVDERTCVEVLREYAAIPVRPAPTNAFTARREAVAGALTRLVDGKPGLVISPACRTLRKGMAGAYKYRRVRIAHDERYADQPDKGFHSHVCEALQYALSGAGETNVVMRRAARSELTRPVVAPTDFNIWRAAV
jgi:Terminase large subunit, T4likevirus-type, N-terminal